MFAAKGTIFEFVFKVNHENLEQVLYFFPKVFILVLSLYIIFAKRQGKLDV